MTDETEVVDAAQNRLGRGGHLSREATQRSLWLMGVLDVLVYLGGIASTYNVSIGVGGLAAALGVIAITNFLFFYWFNEELRDAIAATIILFYITLFASLFNKDLRNALNNEVGRDLLTSLTAFVSVLGGFYFAGRSIEKAMSGQRQAVSGQKHK